MDGDKKKHILIGILVVCLVAAAGITYFTISGGSSGAEAIKGQMMWVKCANPNCNAEYEMSKEEYYTSGEKNQGALPACKKCSESSLYDAVKCEKCGIVFISGIAKSDSSDRCPECGFSKMLGDTQPVK